MVFAPAGFLRRFRHSPAGAALIEFALVAPLLLALLFGAVEFGRYVLITQKVEKSGYTLGNVLTQYTAADIAQQSTFDGVFNQYATVMAPYGSDPATQRVIFTSVTKDPSDHQVKIDWQKSGGGTLDNGQTVSIVDGLAASAIVGNNPAPEQVATFSGNVNITNLLVPGSSTGMADGENMIVTEVFYQYKPLVAPLLKSVGITVTPTTLVRRTFMRPREGDLNVTSCPAGTANWPPGCSGPYNAMNSGDHVAVNNTATGYTGSETATCSGATVTFSGPTCTAIPTDGVCGAANNGTFSDANGVNAAGLCSSGAASPTSVSGNSPWSWSCGGGGGARVNCSASATCSCAGGETTTGDGLNLLPSASCGAQYCDSYICAPNFYHETWTCTNSQWVKSNYLTSCFLGDVNVTLADGSTRPMTELRPGDVVRGKGRNNTVQSVPSHVNPGTIYGFNGGKAFVTGGHPFWTKDGWKAIDPALTPTERHNVKTTRLAVGDALWLSDGKRLKITSIDAEDSGPHTVYSPVMNGDHTYYANGILVHNKPAPCPTPQSFGSGACPGAPAQCGAANGNTFSDANAVNTAGLCSIGTAAPSAVSGNGPWSWTCGVGGRTVSCATTTASCQDAWIPYSGSGWTDDCTNFCNGQTSSSGSNCPVDLNSSGQTFGGSYNGQQIGGCVRCFCGGTGLGGAPAWCVNNTTPCGLPPSTNYAGYSAPCN